jgi:hypothetical protein
MKRGEMKRDARSPAKRKPRKSNTTKKETTCAEVCQKKNQQAKNSPPEPLRRRNHPRRQIGLYNHFHLHENTHALKSLDRHA